MDFPHRVHNIGVFSCRFTVAWSGMKKISSFFNNLPLRKRPSTVFWLKQAYSQPATECGLMEGKLSVGLSSPSSISFNDYPIVRNCTLRSFSKICRQIEGNLHMILPLIIEPCSTCSQVYHSDHSVTEPLN